MYKLSVTDHFDAAHFIANYEGKCSREHGHRWTVEVVVEGMELLDDTNMLIDFKYVKEQLKIIVDKLDHFQLNEVLEDDNVTAEYLAKYVYVALKHKFSVKLTSVSIWESPECGVEYYE